jgi:starch synthase
MANKNILFVSQEIAPYLPANDISTLGRELPLKAQSIGLDVRAFMPKYGTVNERRNQLHEVIRLSGMNINIDDNDHPLLLKVASMQPSRIQVYFIDNDDYFQKSEEDEDAVGSNRKDNDERAIFFARGTMETVKKLNWETSIVHCSGWITALTPLYLRKMLTDDTSLNKAKIIYSIIPGEVTGGIDERIMEKLRADGLKPKEVKKFADVKPDTDMLHRLALEYADAVIFAKPDVSESIKEYVENRKMPVLSYEQTSEGIEAYSEFYKSLLPNEK